MPSAFKKISVWILDLLPYSWRDNIFGFKRFKSGQRQHPERQMLVMFVDGKGFHGGLSDRFKGIVSLFHYSLCRNIVFKINYTYPFELSNYLVPNEYNWQLSASDKLTYHGREARFMNLIGNPSIKRLVNLKTKRQIHAYANRDIVSELNQWYKTNYQWGGLFKKLFKPTGELQQLIDSHKTAIGGSYACAVFRFQQLLGDFTEYEYTELPDSEKEKLITRCREAVCKLQASLENKKILVTSDSARFLQAVSDMENVYAFPAKVVHIDNTTGESHDVYMKSFLDFYLLSEGEKIYAIGTSQMYKSEFPLYAAKLNNRPFERILIE